MSISKQDRAKGALIGAFIGDALALGCHWYYDLEEQHKDYSTWINDYTNPKKGRYHENQKAGRITSYNVCYTKLLRLNTPSVT